MPLPDPVRVLRDGAVLSIGASTYLLALLRFNPRLFLRHFPREIRDIVPPRSVKEKQIAVLLGLPLGILFIGFTCASALNWRASAQGSPSFWEPFLHVFSLFFLFNLVDLLILDWLIVCRLRPRWLTIPGTEHIVTPSQYLHHFKGFLAGIIVSLGGGLGVAAVLHIFF